MFYTLVQDFGPNYETREFLFGARYICFEANNFREALSRVEWFGIDLEDMYEHAWKRWFWDSLERQGVGRGFEMPSIDNGSVPIFQWEDEPDQQWIVVRLDDNISSSLDTNDRV
jgi:hypothetical protein